MCQVVAYRRLKTIENSKTVSRKSGHGRLQQVVVYERFWCFASFGEVVAYGRWSHVEVRLYVQKGQTGLKFSCWSICLFRQQGVSLSYFVFILQV